jgi:hypothetical protein
MFSSRRAFILAVLAAPAVAVGSQGTSVSLDDFVGLSERLLERTNLDRDLARTYLGALLASRDTAVVLANFVQRAGNPVPEERVLAATIVEWWYTGVYDRGGARHLATHAGALMWRALDMPAPGTCAAPFGAWSRPPRSFA